MTVGGLPPTAGMTEPAAAAAGSLEAAAATSSTANDALLLTFTVSCAAVATGTMPLAVAGRDLMLAVALRVARKPPSTLDTLDLRVLTALLASSPLRDAWLRPALQREMAMAQLAFLLDCFTFRCAAGSLSRVVTRLAALRAPAALSHAQRLLPIAEAAGSAEATPRAPGKPGASRSDTSDTTATTAELAGVDALAVHGSGTALHSRSHSDGASAASAAPPLLPPPSVAAALSLNELAHSVAGVAQALRRLELRYLAPASPIRLSLTPAGADKLRSQLATTRQCVQRIAALGRLAVMPADAATAEANLAKIRRTFDAACTEVVHAVACGPVFRLVNSPDGPPLLAAAVTLLCSPAYLGARAPPALVHPPAAAPPGV